MFQLSGFYFRVLWGLGFQGLGFSVLRFRAWGLGFQKGPRRA